MMKGTIRKGSSQDAAAILAVLEDVYEAFEKIQEKDDFFVQDDKCVIRIEYKSKLISRDSTNVARTRKNINL